MGWPSSHEDDQEKRDDAVFLDGEVDPDIKRLLASPVEPRVFARRSKAPPKLKNPKKLTAQQRKYRTLQRAKMRTFRAQASRRSETEEIALWHLQQLRLMVSKQALLIGPGAPYDSMLPTGNDDSKSLNEIEVEIGQLKVVLLKQQSILKRQQRAR